MFVVLLFLVNTVDRRRAWLHTLAKPGVNPAKPTRFSDLPAAVPQADLSRSTERTRSGWDYVARTSPPPLRDASTRGRVAQSGRDAFSRGGTGTRPP